MAPGVGRGSARPVAFQTFHDFFHLPEPEVVDGRPRVISARAGVRSDVGFLNFASTGTALAALVVLAVVASCAARTAAQATGPTVLIASLALGAVVGRWRFRGKFSGMPGVILAFVVGGVVELLAALVEQLIGGGDALMLTGPAAAAFVVGLDWSWAQRLRWIVMASLVVAGDAVARPNPPIALLVGLIVSVAVFLWSAHLDVLTGYRHLAPVSRFSEPVERTGIELTVSLVVALLLGAVLIPFVFIPSLGFDLPSGADPFAPFAVLIAAMLAFLAWLVSLFGDRPTGELNLPDWLIGIVEMLRGLVRGVSSALAPIASWIMISVVPRLPYLIAAVIIALLLRRTIGSFRRWHEKLAARRWGARAGDVLEAAGRRRGRRRRRHETLLGYARVLVDKSVPDPRLIEVAAVMTQSCFMATEIDPARRAQAEATLDDIIASHPAPGWARRVRRAVGL